MASTETQVETASDSSHLSDRLVPPPKRKAPWLWLALPLVLVGGAATWYVLGRSDRSGPAEQPPPSLPVELGTVETTAIESSSQFVGQLEATERATLRPEAEGRIIEIFVRSGDRVGRGTPILQLRPDRNQAEVDAAAANVRVQRALQENAAAALRAARAQLRQAEASREAARAQLVEADAEVALQQQEFERTEFLVAEGVQPRQQLDIQTRNINAAIAARDSARKTLDASEASVQAVSEQVSGARSTLDRETAAVAQAEAEVAVNSEDLDLYRLRSPIGGVVSDIPVKVGDYASFGDVMTAIVQNQTLELRLPVPSDYGDRLQLGLPVELRLQPESEPVAIGQVSFISPQINSEDQTILAKASFDNSEGRLRDAQLVRAKIVWNTETGVLVPTTAIFRVGGQAFVYATGTGENDQLIARQAPVTLGKIQGNRYHVLDGIEPGTEIVTSGLLNLQDGVPIAPKQP